MSKGLQKLHDARAARARAAREEADLNGDLEAGETRDDDEETECTKQAWLTPNSFIDVDVQDCDFDGPKPANWPVKCKAYKATAPELLALKENVGFKKVMRVADRSLRTTKLTRQIKPEDYCDTWGASVIAAVVGFNDDGTIEGIVWIQKRLGLLQDLGWNYAGSTEMPSGLDRTFKAPHF